MAEAAASAEAYVVASLDLLQAKFQAFVEEAIENMKQAAQGMNETTSKLNRDNCQDMDFSEKCE